MTDYLCRGCSGTCCTGIGSEPCTCPPPSLLERAAYFMSHLPTDSQLDARMPNGDTGREILAALEEAVGWEGEGL